MQNQENIQSINEVKEQYKECVFPYFGKNIEFLQDKKLSYPERLPKPVLKNNHTTEEVLQYANELEIWEIQKSNREKYTQFVDDYNNQIDDFIEEEVKNFAGLFSIPERYQHKVWEKAWEDGHSNGWYSVYQHLVELVYIFD